MDTNEMLTQIETLTPVVAERHAEQESAIASEQEAEAVVLTRVIETVRPALRALASRLPATYRCWWIDNARTETARTYHAERGVCLTDTEPRPSSRRRDAHRGAYTGCDLFLLDDGTLAEVHYSGHWSNWQGEIDEWQGEMRPVTVAAVAAEYDLDALLSSLVTRLQQQAEAKRPTEAAKQRAERLRAVAALVKMAK